MESVRRKARERKKSVLSEEKIVIIQVYDKKCKVNDLFKRCEGGGGQFQQDLKLYVSYNNPIIFITYKVIVQPVVVDLVNDFVWVLKKLNVIIRAVQTMHVND